MGSGMPEYELVPIWDPVVQDKDFSHLRNCLLKRMVKFLQVLVVSFEFSKTIVFWNFALDNRHFNMSKSQM